MRCWERSIKGDASPTALHPEDTGEALGKAVGHWVLQVSPCCRDWDLETPPSAGASGALQGLQLEKAALTGDWEKLHLQEKNSVYSVCCWTSRDHWDQGGEKSPSPPVSHQTLQPVRLNIMPAVKEGIFTKSTSMVTWQSKKHRFGAERQWILQNRAYQTFQNKLAASKKEKHLEYEGWSEMWPTLFRTCFGGKKARKLAGEFL